MRLAESSKASKASWASCCEIKLVKELNRFHVGEAMHNHMRSDLILREFTSRENSEL
jgi:hypothetical protein